MRRCGSLYLCKQAVQYLTFDSTSDIVPQLTAIAKRTNCHLHENQYCYFEATNLAVAKTILVAPPS